MSKEPKDLMEAYGLRDMLQGGGRCENCAWWTKIHPDEGGFDDFGDCINPNFVNNLEVESYRPDQLCLMASGIYDSFMTGPRFGCVHFERRPQEQGDA